MIPGAHELRSVLLRISAGGSRIHICDHMALLFTFVLREAVRVFICLRVFAVE